MCYAPARLALKPLVALVAHASGMVVTCLYFGVPCLVKIHLASVHQWQSISSFQMRLRISTRGRVRRSVRPSRVIFE